MNKATETLRTKARELLQQETVSVVIGYEKDSRGKSTPAFVTRPEDCDKLIFDETCYHNLAGYLLKPEVKQLGRPAIVVKGCDSRAVNQLITESRLKREDITIIGVECPGMDKAVCVWCEQHTPVVYDELIAAENPVTKAEPVVDPLMELSDEERWQYWLDQFSKCIKCYACRQVCPICHCPQCLAEKNIPQWIDSSPHPRGNLKWNLIRAFHLAGRCVECGECERACPMNIPLSRLSASMKEMLKEKFGSTPGMDAESRSVLTTFNENDEEDFFL